MTVMNSQRWAMNCYWLRIEFRGELTLPFFGRNFVHDLAPAISDSLPKLGLGLELELAEKRRFGAVLKIMQ